MQDRRHRPPLRHLSTEERDIPHFRYVRHLRHFRYLRHADFPVTRPFSVPGLPAFDAAPMGLEPPIAVVARESFFGAGAVPGHIPQPILEPPSERRGQMPVLEQGLIAGHQGNRDQAGDPRARQGPEGFGRAALSPLLQPVGVDEHRGRIERIAGLGGEEGGHSSSG